MDKKKTEEEKLKKAIFDGMSNRRQKQVLRRGYDEWDPFQKPKDPIDIRQDVSKRTTQSLVRDFLSSCTSDHYNNEYGRGAFELCLGIINKDDRYIGMFDFAKWYLNHLKKEGYA